MRAQVQHTLQQHVQCGAEFGSEIPCVTHLHYSNTVQQGYALAAQLHCALIAAALAQMQHTLQRGWL